MDVDTYTYEVYLTTLPNGQLVMVQIFRDPVDGRHLHAQMAFKSAAGGTWGIPYQLEKQ